MHSVPRSEDARTTKVIIATRLDIAGVIQVSRALSCSVRNLATSSGLYRLSASWSSTPRLVPGYLFDNCGCERWNNLGLVNKSDLYSFTGLIFQSEIYFRLYWFIWIRMSEFQEDEGQRDMWRFPIYEPKIFACLNNWMFCHKLL